MGNRETSEPRLQRVAGPRGDVVVLELAGELDLAVSSRLSALVEEAVAERPRLVVADLAEVAFMDSTVLRGLLHANREVSEGGGRLIVAAPSRPSAGSSS